MIPQKLKTWLTLLYPRAWRERYGEEFNVLLEQSLHSPLDVVDVFFGALDAHIQSLNDENLSWRVLNMVNKLRTTILIVFTAFIGFVIAGFALVGIADDSPMISFMQTNKALFFAWSTIQVAAVIALVAILIGGLPLLITILRQAFSTSHKHRRWLLVPVISFLVLTVYVAFLFLLGVGRIQIPGVVPVVQPGSFPAGNRLVMAGFMLVFLAGAVASTWAVWKVLTGSEVENSSFRTPGQTRMVNLYQFAFIPAEIAAFAMLVMLIATLAWGWISFTAFPDEFSGNFGPWLTSTKAWYFAIVTLMVLSVLAAFYGLARGRKAKLPQA